MTVKTGLGTTTSVLVKLVEPGEVSVNQRYTVLLGFLFAEMPNSISGGLVSAYTG
ncbi:MAG: hypothetical protein NTX45_12090 [Proteobacteria bacterium]|nr:hypothetical protein [Pseudomonadota bacterium]